METVHHQIEGEISVSFWKRKAAITWQLDYCETAHLPLTLHRFYLLNHAYLS